MSRNVRIFAIFSLTLALALFSGAFSGQAFGQGGQDQGVDTGNQVPDIPTNTGGGGGGGVNLPDGALDVFRQSLEVEDVEVEPDLRFERGFIGPTAADAFEGVESRSAGFIGQRREGEFGGGVNSTNQGGFQGATGTQPPQSFFEVQRKGVRARVRSAMGPVIFIGSEVSDRFQTRLQNMPSTRDYGQQVNVSLQNRTAILTGTVRSAEESRRIERQLRLEPGVYKIDNRLEIN